MEAKKRSEFEYMSVSDDKHNWFSRIVIINTDEIILAVDIGSKENFENGKRFSTACWNYCKSIPKKITRPMTQEECVIWSVTEGASGWVVQAISSMVVSPQHTDYSAGEIRMYRRAKVTDGKIGEWEKFEFEVEEVEE